MGMLTLDTMSALLPYTTEQLALQEFYQLY
jgi:hypothetical protein